MSEYPEFADMEFSSSFNQIKSWAPLITTSRDPLDKVAATRIKRGTDINFEALTRAVSYTHLTLPTNREV